MLKVAWQGGGAGEERKGEVRFGLGVGQNDLAVTVEQFLTKGGWGGATKATKSSFLPAGI